MHMWCVQCLYVEIKKIVTVSVSGSMFPCQWNPIFLCQFHISVHVQFNVSVLLLLYFHDHYGLSDNSP